MALLTNINGKFSVSDVGAVTFNNAFTFPTADGDANYVLQTNGSGQLAWALNGNGDISGSGTANTVTKFTGAKTIGNGPITFATNNSTFAGDVTIGPKSNASIATSESGGATTKLMSASVGRSGTYSNHEYHLMQNSAVAVTIDVNKNVTFEAPVWIPDYIYHVGDPDTYFGFPTNNEWKVTVGGSTKIFADSNAAYMYYQGGVKLQTTSTGVTVTGAVSATSFLGDLNGTINTATTAVTQPNATDNTKVATTAYVVNKIAELPAGLIFLGTWDADNNTPTLASGGGERSEGTATTLTANKLIDSGATFTTAPAVVAGDRVRVVTPVGPEFALVTSVDSATQLTLAANIVTATGEAYILEVSPFLLEGNYYIVSDNGATNLNGITDWKVGDWVVASSTNVWQKIDNSSVLDGSGTGGSFAGWSGSGTSVTLGNAPVTFSGNNSTFAGDIYVTGTSNSLVVISRDNMFVDGGQFYIGADDSTTNDSFRQRTASGSYFIESRKSGTWTNRLQINTAGTLIGSQGATFAGSVTSSYLAVNGSAIVAEFNGAGSSYVQGAIALRSSNADTPEARGQGVFMYNQGTDTTWYTGTTYSNADRFIIGRATDASLNTEAARINNSFLTVLNSGNVGIGRTSPTFKLDVGVTTSAQGIRVIAGNAYANLDIESSRTSGNIGGIRFMTTGDANKTAEINGTVNDGLRFVTGTGGSDVLETAMSITGTHNVGIGTTSPRNKLTVKTAGSAQVETGLRLVNPYGFDLAGTGSKLVFAQDRSDSENFEMAAIQSSQKTGGSSVNSDLVFSTRNSTLQERFRITFSGNLIAPAVYNLTTSTAANMYVSSTGFFYRSTSSLKYKTDVRNYDKGLNEVMQLQPKYYKGKNDGDTQFAGLIAEDVHDLGLNEFVQYAEDGTPDALAYANMVALLTKAIQELKAEIEILKNK